MTIAPAVGYMPGARKTFAKTDSLGPAMTTRGASSVRPAAMYPFTLAPAVSVIEIPLDIPLDTSICIDTTKAGKPCKAKKVQDTDYCFSHVRNHRGAEPTAD